MENKLEKQIKLTAKLYDCRDTARAFTIMTTKEEIEKLHKRRDMAAYQRKITTQLCAAIEYDQEIVAIDRRIEQLNYKLKSEERRL